MEGKFSSKILTFVTAITHNCDNFSCWSQMFHILPSICEDFILPSEIGFFERALWVHQKFFIAKRHFLVVLILYSVNKGPKDELDMSTKSNWSYFDSLEVITTQKCSNLFENNAEKWHLLTILAITFDPQRIFSKVYLIGK